MIISKYKKVTPKIFDDEVVKGVKARVIIGKNEKANNFCMRVFEISEGGYTPKHSHSWEHEIFVHEGKGVIFKDGNWEDIESGSYVFIPGEEEHQLKNTSKSPLIFICVIPSGVPEI